MAMTGRTVRPASRPANSDTATKVKNFFDALENLTAEDMLKIPLDMYLDARQSYEKAIKYFETESEADIEESKK